MSPSQTALTGEQEMDTVKRKRTSDDLVRCTRCGRRLTAAESIRKRIGPVCENRAKTTAGKFLNTGQVEEGSR